jgi:serine/threonine-protein kinase
LIGQSLAHYEILSLIGKGGMGEVYHARDTKLGREVAIKLLPREVASDPERLARFRREAKLLAALNHPSIGALYGIEETDEHVFLVMELAEGEDLSKRLQLGPLPVDEALAVALQIAESLEAAHAKNIVHRDLKPANVMYSPSGRVKLLDFGLARAYHGEEASGDPMMSPTITAAMTQQGMVLGTAAYMSPEQARGKSVDRQSDI